MLEHKDHVGDPADALAIVCSVPRRRGRPSDLVLIRPADMVPLGRTGIQLTRLGLGMRPLGLLGPGHEATGRAIIKTAAGLGIRYLDTAPIYGYGESEQRLGEVAAALPAGTVVSTKVGRALIPDSPRRPVSHILAGAIAGGPSEAMRVARRATAVLRAAAARAPGRTEAHLVATADYSYDGAIRSIEGSLARIGRDRLDIVLIHDPDNHLVEAMAGAFRALDELRSDGTISAVGVSSNHWQPLAALAAEGDFDCLLLAGRYSLLDQTAHAELLPLCGTRGISLIVGGVFNSGILADPWHKATFDYRPASKQRLAEARRIANVCRRHGVDVKAAAIQFPYRHPAVTSVLVGPASVAELEEDERLLRTPVPASLWEELAHERLIVDDPIIHP